MYAPAHRRHASNPLQAFRRLGSGRLRVVLLALFALGIAMQSLLGTLSNLHEVISPAHMTHGVVSHVDVHDHEAAVHDGTDAAEGGSLHVLLHATHCCSHSVWIAGGATLVSVMAELRVEAPAAKPRPIPAPERTALFRPPIAV